MLKVIKFVIDPITYRPVNFFLTIRGLTLVSMSIGVMLSLACGGIESSASDGEDRVSDPEQANEVASVMRPDDQNSPAISSDSAAPADDDTLGVLIADYEEDLRREMLELLRIWQEVKTIDDLELLETEYEIITDRVELAEQRLVVAYSLAESEGAGKRETPKSILALYQEIDAEDRRVEAMEQSANPGSVESGSDYTQPVPTKRTYPKPTKSGNTAAREALRGMGMPLP